MSVLNSNILSTQTQYTSLEMQEFARQAQLFAISDISHTPQTLTNYYPNTNDYMNQMPLYENAFPTTEGTYPSMTSVYDTMMFPELSALNNNMSETMMPSVSPQTTSLGLGDSYESFMTQLLGMPIATPNTYNMSPLGTFEMNPLNTALETPTTLQAADIETINGVIDSLTDIVTKYTPEATPPVIPDPVTPAENNIPVADDMYQIKIDDGTASLMLGGKEITQNGIYGNDTIEKTDDAIIIHQNDYDIVFTSDAETIADAETTPSTLVVDNLALDNSTADDISVMTSVGNLADAVMTPVSNLVDATVNLMTLNTNTIDDASTIDVAQDDNQTLINLDGDVIQPEDYINNVFA